MKKNVDGIIVEMTPEEEKFFLAEQAEAERQYWEQDYDTLVNTEIRKRYTEPQEFAILRNREKNPAKYKEYYRYCDECTALVREKLEAYGLIPPETDQPNDRPYATIESLDHRLTDVEYIITGEVATNAQ